MITTFIAIWASANSLAQPAQATPVDGKLSLVPTVSSELLLDLEESSDGTRMITSSFREWDRNYNPRLWDAKAMAMLKVLKGHLDPVTEVAFSSDGKRVLTLSGASARVWDARLGRVMAVQPVEAPEKLTYAAFAGNGDLITSTNLGRISRIASTFGKGSGNVTPIAKLSDKVITLAVDQSSGQVVASTATGISVIAPDGTLKSISGVATARDLRISKDGKDLLATLPTDAVVYDLTTLAKRFGLKHLTGSRSVGTTNDAAEFVGANGELVLVCTSDGDLQLFSRTTGKLVRVLKGHSDVIREIRISRDGKRIGTYADDNLLKIWDVETGKEFSFTQADDLPTAAGFSFDGKEFVVGYRNGTIYRHDLATGLFRTTTYSSVQQMAGFKLLDDGRIYIKRNTGDRNLRGTIYDGEVRQVDSLNSAFQVPRGLDSEISRNGRYAGVYASDYSSYALHNIANPKQYDGKKTLIETPPTYATFSPDGTKLCFTGEEGYFGVIDTDTGEQTAGWKTKQKESLGYSAISPDNSYAVTAGWNIAKKPGDYETIFQAWNIQNGKIVGSLGKNNDVFARATFAPDGGSVVINDGGVIWVVSMDTGKETAKFESVVGKDGTQLFSGCIPTFSADGQYVWMASTSAAGVWEAKTGKKVLAFDQGNDAADLSPNGKFFLRSKGSRLEVYSLETGAKVASQTTDETTSHVQFNADGTRILTLDPLNGISVWQFSGDSLKVLGSLQSTKDGGWLVLDEQGRFDATDPASVNAACYVYEWSGGLEPIAVSQFKSTYYDPGLFGKLLGTNPEPRREVPPLTSLALYPAIGITADQKKAERVSVEITDRNGGIGKTTVSINGKVVEQKEGSGFFRVDLAQYRSLLIPAPSLGPNGRNVLTVRSSNAKGDLTSPPAEFEIPLPADLKVPDTQLYGLFVGAGNYVGSGGDLKAPPADAIAMAEAVTKTGERLLPGRVHTTVLTTAPGGTKPSRSAITEWLAATAKVATSRDIVMVFFAGHGTNVIGDQRDYFFLTPDADPTDVGPAAIGTSAISGSELQKELAAIPAAKQIVILDTCHSGAASKSLDLSSRSLSGDYQRAYEAIRDGSGTYLLAGSASDQLSYEASNVNHGMLTYALLEAIDRVTPDGLRSSESGQYFVDVERWMKFAANRVESLKAEANVAGVQRPEFRRSNQGVAFDIGVTSVDKRGELMLRSPVPIVIVGNFQQEEEDPAKLEPEIERAMRASSAFKPWFEVAKHPGAYRVAGNYVTEGETLKVKVAFQKFDSAGTRNTLETFTVEGKVGEIGAKVRAGIEERLAKLKSGLDKN